LWIVGTLVEKTRESKDSDFQRVVRYFLNHEKPSSEPVKKSKKRIEGSREKPSTKAKKR
jgi:hypothetical protein